MMKYVLSALFSLMIFLPGSVSAQKITQLTGNYDSTGSISCTRVGTSEQFTCAYGVIRGLSNQAEMHIISPTSYKRVLLFNADTVTSPDEEIHVDAKKEGDMWIVTFNKREVYQVPLSAL